MRTLARFIFIRQGEVIIGTTVRNVIGPVRDMHVDMSASPARRIVCI